MAYEKHKNEHNLPVVAATTILPRQPLKYVGTNSLLVAPAATLADVIDGFNGAGTYLTGEVVPVLEPNQVVKAKAVASVGVAAEVGVGSNNGALGPQTFIAASGHYVTGKSLSAAAAGEIFSVDVRVRKV